MKMRLERSSKAYIILIIILIALSIASPYLINRPDYIAGIENRVDINIFYSFILFIILFPLMACIAFIASIIAVASLVHKHSNISQIIFKLALIFLGPVIVCCSFFLRDPGGAVFLKGFEQWVQQNVDIDAIQTWLESEGQIYSGESYSIQDGFPDDLPECITKLRPEFILFNESDSSNELQVEFIWPMFMDEYGLIIGSPDMEMPEIGHIILDYGDYEYRRPVKPGAYVFSRG